MKRKIALALTIVLVLTQVLGMTSAFASTRGKKLAIFKYESDLGNGKKLKIW